MRSLITTLDYNEVQQPVAVGEHSLPVSLFDRFGSPILSRDAFSRLRVSSALFTGKSKTESTKTITRLCGI